MRRREALLEQQPHRVALVAEGRLDADEHVAEALAEHEETAAVGLLSAGRRAPLPLDLGELALAAHVIVGRDARRHVGVGAEARGIAAEDPRAQRVDRARHLDAVAGRLQRQQRVDAATRRPTDRPPCRCCRHWAGS